MSKVIDFEIPHSKPGATPLDGVMRAGDCVEFISDLQTEKGPSTGYIAEVDDTTVRIRHSDHLGESFESTELIVKMETRYRDGLRKLWILK